MPESTSTAANPEVSSIAISQSPMPNKKGKGINNWIKGGGLNYNIVQQLLLIKGSSLDKRTQKRRLKWQKAINPNTLRSKNVKPNISKKDMKRKVFPRQKQKNVLGLSLIKHMVGGAKGGSGHKEAIDKSPSRKGGHKGGKTTGKRKAA